MPASRVRYLSRALPEYIPKSTLQEDIHALTEETSKRFRELYADESGAGSSSGAAAAGDVFLIPVPVTANLTITEGYLAGIDPVASGNHPIYVAVLEDDVGGHLIRWDPADFHGASTAGLNEPSNEWSVDDGPTRATLYHFVRHPATLKWWLASWISYDKPVVE